MSLRASWLSSSPAQVLPLPLPLAFTLTFTLTLTLTFHPYPFPYLYPYPYLLPLHIESLYTESWQPTHPIPPSHPSNAPRTLTPPLVLTNSTNANTPLPTQPPHPLPTLPPHPPSAKPHKSVPQYVPVCLWAELISSAGLSPREPYILTSEKVF